MEKLRKENGYVIEESLANAIKSMIREDRFLPSEDLVGNWDVDEPKYQKRDAEDPEKITGAIIPIRNGDKVINLPLYLIASARVTTEDANGGTPYVQGKKVFRTSQLAEIKSKSYLLKDHMPDVSLIIPKRISIDALEIRENMNGEIIINSSLIEGYYDWAMKKTSKGLPWPNIMAYQAALGVQGADRDTDLTYNGHKLTPVPEVNAQAPKIEQVAVRLYLTNPV